MNATVPSVAQSSGWPPAPGHLTLPVWPGIAPGASANPPAEADTTTANDVLVAGRPVALLSNVFSPTITLYPAKGRNTGAAVVVFPGGAYQVLAIDVEGTEVCDWLSSIGITCLLLKYRVPGSGPYPKSAAALQDAQRALGLVRQHAAEWQIDPERIGVLGFSAGAFLAAALSTHFNERIYSPVDAADQLSCRPDFAVIVYPGFLVLDEKGLPPTRRFGLPAQRRPNSSSKPKTTRSMWRTPSSTSRLLRRPRFRLNSTSTQRAATDTACAPPRYPFQPGPRPQKPGFIRPGSCLPDRPAPIARDMDALAALSRNSILKLKVSAEILNLLGVIFPPFHWRRQDRGC